MDLLLQVRCWLATATVTAAALGVGRCAAAMLRSNVGGPRRQVVWETTLGFVVAGMLLACLGFAGLLRTGTIVVGTVLFAGAGIHRLRTLVRSPSRVEPDVESPPNVPPRLTALVVACAASCAAASGLSASAPPTAGDALCYHLELPKQFLAAGRLVVPADDDNAVYPLLAEMWFVWGLAADGAATAQLLHWVCGLLTAGVAAIAARPIVGRNGSIVVAGLVLVVPGINNQMTAPLNDVAAAMLCTAVVAAWLKALETPTLGSFAAVGLLLGGALGVKHTAIVFALATTAVAGLTLLAESGRRRVLLRGCGVAAVTALVVAAPWYVRAYLHRGDPVYPFLTRHAEADGPSTFPEAKTPLGRGPAAWALAPWSLTMEPDRFGGRGHQPGPLPLMFAPLVPVVLRRRYGPTLVATAGLYAFGCVCLRQNVRFLLPVVPAASCVVVAGLQTLRSWPAGARQAALCGVAAVVLLCTAIPIGRAGRHVRVALGLESRESYLARVEPTTELAQKMSALLPAEASVLSQESRRFYLPRATTRENILRRRTGYHRNLVPGTADAALRGLGFTHVLLAEGEGSKTQAYDGTLSTLVDREASREAMPRAPVFTASGRDADGNVRRYRVFELR